MEEHHGKAAWRSRTIDMSRASPLCFQDDASEPARSPTMSALKHERLGKLRASMSPVLFDSTHPHPPSHETSRLMDEAYHAEAATIDTNSSQEGQSTPPLPTNTTSPPSLPRTETHLSSSERAPRRSSIRRSSSAIMSSSRATSAPPVHRSSTVVSFSDSPPSICSFDKTQPSAVIRGPTLPNHNRLHLLHERSPLGSSVASSSSGPDERAPVRQHRRSSSLFDFTGIIE